MHLHSYTVRNYRRLRNAQIDLAHDISIFVGANNSGKTSATQAIYAFVSGSKDRLSLFDFSSACWKEFDQIGDDASIDGEPPNLPSISIDFWFEVGESDLYLVMPLLPSTDWSGSLVGLRVEFGARDCLNLINNFRTSRDEAQKKAAALEQRENEQYVPWPKNLTDFLGKNLREEFEFKYFVLDRTQFDDDFNSVSGYKPLPVGKDPTGSSLLNSLIRVDNLSAQRHLSDQSAAIGLSGGRSEDLSKRLSKFYKRNLDQREEDHSALRALFDSERGLNEHLTDVFKGTLDRLSKLGYPGLNNPRLEIKSALNPATIMSSQDARVHYALSDSDDDLRLPDIYNGLGFKNLIYMVVEILDLHAQWIAENDGRAPLHLIFIEEPEAHLHAQLQQVFVRNVLGLLQTDEEGESAFSSQMVVTTHSPHILYERGFQPIRYFRRHNTSDEQTSVVLNLSDFYRRNSDDRDFLQRYLKLTHCDLFFADAAILVEGNVERLLLPLMIEKEAVSLRSASLSILEVGGAFGHKFKALIEFLGLVALVITDLDSVTAIPVTEADPDEDIEFELPGEEKDKPSKKAGKACLPTESNAITSNQTLIQWLPKKQSIADLFAVNQEDFVSEDRSGNGFKVRIAYQFPTLVTWNGVEANLCGRTLEEEFGLANAEWCQEEAQRHLGLRLRNRPEKPFDLAKGLNKRVGGKSFDKTRFALGILTEPPINWHVPNYIKDGLKWLDETLGLETTPAKIPGSAFDASGKVMT